MVRVKCWVLMKKFKLNIPIIIIFGENFFINGNNRCFTVRNIGMHSDINKLCVVIDKTDFYVLILIYLTSTLIQGHMDAGKQKLRFSYLPYLFRNLDGI